MSTQIAPRLALPHVMRSMELIDATVLQYQCHEGSPEVACAILQSFCGMKTMVLRFAKGYDIPEHWHSKEVIEVLLRGVVEFVDLHGKKDIMGVGMVRFCGSEPYRATVVEDAYILVMQPPDAKVIVEKHSPELGFFSQQLATDLG